MRRLILGFAAVAPIVLVLLWRQAPAAGVGVLALSHALVLYATLRPNVQWLGPVITHFETDRNEVWLTIDDGPTEDTYEVLDLFDARGVKATFFVKGILATERAEMIRDILRRGHTIANHSHTHPAGTLWISPPARIAAQIDDCNAALERLSGSKPTWFRAPVGFKNPFFHPILEQRAMKLIGWSARGFDAVTTDPEVVLQRLLPDVKPGAILLLHQGFPTSLQILARAIDELQRLGYAFVVPDDTRLKTNR